MRYIFHHWARVAATLCRAEKVLLALDYDGTLTPIVSRPDKAVLSLAMRKALRRAAARDNLDLAVISGRRLGDVKRRVGIRGVFYGGNHGLEISGPGVKFTHTAAIKARPLLGRISRSLRARIRGFSGVILEDKAWVLALHYRWVDKSLIPRLEDIFRSVFDDYSSSGLIDIGRGKQVWEFRPKTTWNKYSALREIEKKVFSRGSPRLTIYIGDDLTDEDVFCRMPPGDISVYVGPVNNRRYRSRARYYLKDVSDVKRLVGKIMLQK